MTGNRKLKWDNLRYFVTIANAQSLRKAAEILKTSPATLSRRIAELEADLRCSLFHRHSHGIEITLEGELLLERCTAINTMISNLREMNDQPHVEQLIHTTIIPSLAHYVILPHINRFFARWPRARITLSTAAELYDLERSCVDIAVRLSRPQKGRYYVRKLASLGLKVYASERLAPAPAGSIPLVTWGTIEQDTSALNGRLRELFPEHHTALVVNDLFALLQAVRAGAGHSILPEFIARDCPDLIAVPGQPPLPPLDVWMVIREESQRRTCVRELADFIVQVTRGALQGEAQGEGAASELMVQAPSPE